MGIAAKDFSAITHDGKEINLKDFKGQTIWLAFFRYASCPLCNLYINQVIRRFDEIKAREIVFLPVFQSTVHEVQKYAGKDDVPFSIICDPNEELYKLYEVGSSVGGFFSLSVMTKGLKAMSQGHLPGKMTGDIARLPSDFVINNDFEIIYRFDGKDIGDHSAIEDILATAN